MLTNREFHLQTGNLGYKTGLSFTNGDSWVTNGILGLLFTTYYFTGYYNFLYSRPSCSNCIFKGNTRASDITLSDCWGYANIAPEMTDNNGLSCIVCHSPKGKNLYNEIIKDVNWKKMSFDDLIKYNSNYNKSAPMGERRESFWDEYNVLDKKELFAKYCSPQEIPTNNNIVKKIVEGFKRIIGVKL